MELIKAPLAVMVPEQIGLLKIEIEQMSVEYVAIKSFEIKVFASPDMEFVKKNSTTAVFNPKRVFANLRKKGVKGIKQSPRSTCFSHFTVYFNISPHILLQLRRKCVNYSGST